MTERRRRQVAQKSLINAAKRKTKRDSGANPETSRNTPQQLSFYEGLESLIEDRAVSPLEKMAGFPVYCSRQIITAFIERYHYFEMVLEIPGSIIDCGVGSGLEFMAFYHLSSILEPYHYTREIVGFDTFAGFPAISREDVSSGRASHLKVGGLKFQTYDALSRALSIHDGNRALGHIPKGRLYKGDVCETLPKFLAENPQLVVALLYLDVDLYVPTRCILDLLLDRVPKGGVIVFDELNHRDYPGETRAVVEALGLRNLRLRRLPFASTTSYCVME